jgi:hypothetical protein
MRETPKAVAELQAELKRLRDEERLR